MIEMSRLGLAAQLLTSAAEAGCRVAIINGKTRNDVNNAVQSIMNSGGISTSSYTMTVATSPATSPLGDITKTNEGDSITITLSCSYSDISWLPPPSFLGSSTITSSATMSSERP
jgi:hypothetical protein